MTLQVSRIFHLKHTRPRNPRGQYLPDRFLWTRPDKLSNWVYFPDHTTAPPPERASSPLSEPHRRAIRDLVVVIVAVALIALFGGV